MEAPPARMLVTFTNRLCLICNKGSDEYNLGTLHDLQVFAVHYLCVLTGMNSDPSGNIAQKEGLLGYLLSDIYSVYKKYTNILCRYCGRCGASLECYSCKKEFHMPCGISNGVRIQMLGRYPSYCKTCSRNIFPMVPEKVNTYLCSICYCPAEEGDILYWPTCCKPDHMIHFDCLKLYALTAGYLTKCPLCMNQVKFRKSIKKFGIYIPNTDANWLISKPDEFILYPLRCSARYCIIKLEMSTVLVPCIICDQKIGHLECTFSNIFLCLDCTRKLWPKVSITNLKINQMANLSSNFPWLFPLIKTVKFRTSLEGIPNKIMQVLKEKFLKWEIVTWHDILNEEDSSVISTKIIELYRGSLPVTDKDNFYSLLL